MNDPKQEYAEALVAYREALTRLKQAKAALAQSKPKRWGPPRIYTLAEHDAFFPSTIPPHNE